MSDLFIGVILVGLFITSFVIITSYGAQKYQVTFDNTSFDVYNQINETYDITKDIQAKSEFNSTNSVFDIVGSFFSQAYSTVKLTASAYNTVDAMKNEAVESANLGPLSNLFTISIGAIILIVIFIAILLRYVIKERT